MYGILLSRVGLLLLLNPWLISEMQPAQVFSIGISLVDVLQNWLTGFTSFFSPGGPFIILTDCMIFPVMSRWNSLPIRCFSLTYNLNGFKSRINRHLINCRFLLKKFPVCFNLFVLFFLVTPCLVVAVQLCMGWIPIKKTWSIRKIFTEKVCRKCAEKTSPISLCNFGE